MKRLANGHERTASTIVKRAWLDRMCGRPTLRRIALHTAGSRAGTPAKTTSADQETLRDHTQEYTYNDFRNSIEPHCNAGAGSSAAGSMARRWHAAGVYQCPPAPRVTAVRAGRLFESNTGRMLARQVVIVSGERITAVGSESQVKIPVGRK